MLKTKIIKIEDKESADFGKSFKIKQAPALVVEDMLLKFSTSNSEFDKMRLPLEEMLEYFYFVNKDGTEIQLINGRVNSTIEDVTTLLILRKEFVGLNISFTRLVSLLTEVKNQFKNFTSMKK